MPRNRTESKLRNLVKREIKAYLPLEDKAAEVHDRRKIEIVDLRSDCERL